MRLRTTLAAVVVVAVALGAGAVLLVVLVRDSLRDGLETTAETRAAALAGEIGSTGVPRSVGEDDEPEEADDEPEEPEEALVWVVDDSGAVLVASHDVPVPERRDGEVRVPGAEHPYVVVEEEAEAGDRELAVVVAVSTEDVAESTSALVPLLAGGLPVVLLVVAGTTWAVVGRALRPVDRIRREVDAISDARLDRRVPVPASRDEVHRLARTMNAMLDRLHGSRDRQRRFVSDASHELRSPLAGLRQTAEVAARHPGALDDGELAETVLEETVRMQRIVDQMLLLTRTEEHGVDERSEVDVDDLVLAEAARVRDRLPTVDTAGVGAGRVLGDRVALGQVVRNLVDNAVRHAAARLDLGVRTDAGRVVLTVDDDGAGIAPTERERVFDRFVRLDEARARDTGGTGLGLAIVREIARSHGGDARVETSPLGGARLVVQLPEAPSARA